MTNQSPAEQTDLPPSAAAHVTTSWAAFRTAAPRIAGIFERRHAANGNLCLLGTIRKDGSPRVSPMEPMFVGDHLVVVGMPNTRKFDDLGRDPRFCLHSATVDPQLADGDAKVFGTVVATSDDALFDEFRRQVAAAHPPADGGPDMGRLERDDVSTFYLADIASASSIELVDDHLEITTWVRGRAETTEHRS